MSINKSKNAKGKGGNCGAQCVADSGTRASGSGTKQPGGCAVGCGGGPKGDMSGSEGGKPEGDVHGLVSSELWLFSAMAIPAAVRRYF